MKMLNDGLCITIGTDDPSISQITLTDEYPLAQAIVIISGVPVAGAAP